MTTVRITAPKPRLKDIPSVPESVPSDLRKVIVAMREHVQALSGTRGTNPITGGAGSGSGNTTIISAPAPGPAPGPPPDLTPAADVAGLTATAGFSTVFIEFTAPTYTQGGGNKHTLIYGLKRDPGDTSPVAFPGEHAIVATVPEAQNFFPLATELGVRWHLWAVHVTKNGRRSINIVGGPSGVEVQTGLIGNDDLGPLVIEAANLAAGAVDLGSTKVTGTITDPARFGALAVGYTVTQYLLATSGVMGNLLVDSAQISSLNVGKLAGGSMSVGNYIQSNTYVPGVNGWRIHANGTAEFAAASIRGQLSAEQMNGYGLTIRHAITGAIIIDAGAAIPIPSNMVNPAANWLNSNVTPQGIGIRTFKVQSQGNNGSLPGWLGGGVRDMDNAGAVVGYGYFRSYTLIEFDRITFAPVFWQTYDVFGNGANASPDGVGRTAASLAGDLNYICDNRRGNWVVITTGDEPRANRDTSGLPAAMYRCGASPAKFMSPNFPYRGAYLLIGQAGCGQGNAANEQVSQFGDSAGAWCEASLTWSKGTLNASGGGMVRSITDLGFTGDLNATNGAPAGTLVAGQSAIAVATAQQNYDGQVKQLYIPGDRNTFYPVALGFANGGSSGTYDLTVSRADVHADEAGLGSYSCHMIVRTSAWGNAPGAIQELTQMTGYGAYQWGVGNVRLDLGTGGAIILMLRGGMSHRISVASPIGAYSATVYPGGYNDPLAGVIGPTTSAPLAPYLNTTYAPSVPFNQASWDVYMPSALIKAAHIQSLSIGVLSTAMNGGATGGGRLGMIQNKMSVYDSSGAEVGEFGYLGP